jgi:ADP-ribose pyrophosphatase
LSLAFVQSSREVEEMVKPWKRIRSQMNQSYRIFSIRTDTTLSPRTGAEHEFYVIESGDWVNVIPITADQQVVMIKQYRHGSRQITLEIPGGLVDPGDTPETAASRELLEETGYRAEEWKKIGVVNPNPAIFSNRCHTFLARNLTKVGNPTPDQTEDIDVVILPLSDIPGLVRKGVIDHALVIAAFYWYSLG